MNKTAPQDDSMTGARDFADVKPNHLAEYFRQEGVRQLDVDVRDAFPDSESVNAALRFLLRAVHKTKQDELPKAS